MGFLLSTITCSEATPMAKACGVVLLVRIFEVIPEVRDYISSRLLNI
jgi:hypothetical protein